MEETSWFSYQILFGIVLGAGGLLLAYIIKSLLSDDDANNTNKCGENKQPQNASKKHTQDHKQQHRNKNKKKIEIGNSSSGSRWNQKKGEKAFCHPWLLTKLKGHTEKILDLDYSNNDKYLATCAEDRTVLVWDIKDITQTDHKSYRTNIEYDHAHLIRWSPDSKAFIICKYQGNNCEVYKVAKKKEGHGIASTLIKSFPQEHQESIIALDIDQSGRFFVTCSNGTDLVLWDFKGRKLARVNTGLMSTNCAKVSPCGTLIAAAGASQTVKVWDVHFDGNTIECALSCEITHSAEICDIDLNSHSLIAICSSDGSWKMYEIGAVTKRGKRACFFKTEGTFEKCSSSPLIALSPGAETLVVASGNTLSFYRTDSGDLEHLIEDVFEDSIRSMRFDTFGKLLYVAGDTHVKVFRNVPWYRRKLESTKALMKQPQTQATKERLQNEVNDCETFLELIAE